MPQPNHAALVLSSRPPVRFSLDWWPSSLHSIPRSTSALFAKSAGARWVAFNHHLGCVKENLDARESEKSLVYGARPPGLSWSKFSFSNEMIAWKGLSPAVVGELGEWLSMLAGENLSILLAEQSATFAREHASPG